VKRLETWSCFASVYVLTLLHGVRCATQKRKGVGPWKAKPRFRPKGEPPSSALNRDKCVSKYSLGSQTIAAPDLRLHCSVDVGGIRLLHIET
jgi:hypothetical protein